MGGEDRSRMCWIFTQWVTKAEDCGGREKLLSSRWEHTCWIGRQPEEKTESKGTVVGRELGIRFILPME
jgi:hypothetical protein